MKSIPSRLAALTFAGASLAVALPSQFVWPASYASVPGNAVMNAPFSYRPVTVQSGQAALGTRCMVIIDPASLPFGTGTVLTQLAFRRDVSYPTQGYAGETGSLSVRLGRANLLPNDVQDVRFARLWDGAWTEVAAIPSFSVPAEPAPGTNLPSFNLVIPFTNSYTWQGGPLAIDIVFTPSGGVPTQFRIDAFAQPRPQTGSSRRVGEGCTGSNGFTPFHYALPETTMPGMSMRVQVEGGRLPPTPGSFEILAFHLVGLQNTSYQGSPLPFALSTFGGLPSCFLRTDPLLSYTVLVRNNSRMFSRAVNSVPLPANSALVGAVLYSQWLLPDTGTAAPLPIIASDAQAITLGEIVPTPTPRMACTIWKYGAAGFDNESGRMVPDGYGPVIRFN